MRMVLRLDRLRLAVRSGHSILHHHDTADALDRVDLVLLEQKRHALDVAVDALLLHHRRQVERGRTDLDAHLGKRVARLLVELGGVQQRLRRDAAHIGQVPPESSFSTTATLRPELRRARMAHTYPPGPVPMTVRSYLTVIDCTRRSAGWLSHSQETSSRRSGAACACCSARWRSESVAKFDHLTLFIHPVGRVAVFADFVPEIFRILQVSGNLAAGEDPAGALMTPT